MTPPRCIGEPVSFLRIERYVLSELPDGEMRAVRAHLEACEACRACAERARAPRVLPPLPMPKSTQRPAKARPRSRPLAVALAAGGLAAAAAVLLVVAPAEHALQDHPAGTARVRGGDVTMTLVRERDGSIAENPEVFAEEDRFKVLVTCPPGHSERFRVWVIEGDEISLALRDDGGFRCGNRVALPGAFRIASRGDATICAAWGEEGSRIVEGSARAAAELLRRSAVCRTVRPVERTRRP